MGWGPFLALIVLALVIGWAVLAYHRLWSLAVMARRPRGGARPGPQRHAPARYEQARRSFPTSLIAKVAGFGPLERDAEQDAAAPSDQPSEEA
ncbi:MAG: hypothetical protein ACR2MA_05545 [Egibacteraceae bacterium]